MISADDLFDQAADNIQRLGLREIPFTESPIDLESDTLRRVFTGRSDELTQVFTQFQNRERRRILVYGRIGIGKSAFLLEVLSVLRRKRPNMLITYISLPSKLDLATTALIAVAKEMPDDDYAQRQLYQMGIPTDKIIKEKSSKAGAAMVFTGELSEKDLPIAVSQYPTVSLDKLLERAQEKYPDGVVIAIDDLDKQDPSRVRQLMHDAQGMLKGRAWFILTGHPTGITGDLLTSERGLFDLQVKLEELEPAVTYQMLINYLSSARIDNDCTDPKDSRCILPFSPSAAKRFCDATFGKPRLFNRLGSAVLMTAAKMQVDRVTPEVLEEGLKAAAATRLKQAALNVQEERVRILLQQRGNLSDETITIEDLESLGFRTFNEILPFLEKLEEVDLAHRLNQDDVKSYAPILLPPVDEVVS